MSCARPQLRPAERPPPGIVALALATTLLMFMMASTAHVRRYAPAPHEHAALSGALKGRSPPALAQRQEEQLRAQAAELAQLRAQNRAWQDRAWPELGRTAPPPKSARHSAGAADSACPLGADEECPDVSVLTFSNGQRYGDGNALVRAASSYRACT